MELRFAVAQHLYPSIVGARFMCARPTVIPAFTILCPASGTTSFHRNPYPHGKSNLRLSQMSNAKLAYALSWRSRFTEGNSSFLI